MAHPLTTLAKPCRRLCVVLALAGALLAGQAAHAQQQGITVMATGEATVQPDVLVLEGTLSESAELAEDAVVAFRDSRRRALNSIEALEIEGLEVLPGAIKLSRGGDMAAMGGMIMPGGGGEQLPPGQIAISQDVEIRIAGVDAMEPDALIDLILSISSAAEEAGIGLGEMTQEDMLMMQMGQGGGSAEMATLRVSDPETAQQEAAADAIAQARAKAQRLAALAGVELGPVTAITEIADTADESGGNAYMNMIFGMMADGGGDPLATSSIEPITVRTALSVTFAIGGE